MPHFAARYARSLLTAMLLLAASSSTTGAHEWPVALAPVDLHADGFLDLRGIAVNADGDLLVADREAGTVTRITPDQSRGVLAAGLERPVGLALDHDGDLLVAEERAGRVSRIGRDGARHTLVSGIGRPRWLAVGEDGTVFISAQRIGRYPEPEPDDESVEAEVILALRPAGTLHVLAEGLRNVQGLVAASDSVLAATQGQRDDHRATGVVFRIPILSDGSAGTPDPLGSGDRLRRPTGLALDRLGAVWVTTAGFRTGDEPSRGAVVKVHPTPNVSPFAEGLEHPTGLAFDTGGNLYVADGHTGRVFRFRAPAAPSVAAPALTNQSPVPVSGTAGPRARVDLFAGDAAIPIIALADRHGRFTTSFTPAPDTSTALEVFATARAGDGLTSAPTRLTVTHDAHPPALIIEAPPAGAHVRQQVPVRVRATDTGPINSVAVTLDAHPIGVAVAPPPPAASIIATAPWDTTTLADGLHTLAAVAEDAAGNAASIAHSVVVDNTPPETIMLDGPSEGATVTTPIVVTFTGNDALTPAAELEFAWRIDGGGFTPFGPGTTTTLSGLAPGAHVFEVKARDRAGNEDPTPARRSFSTGADLRIRISEPTDGATVPAGLVVVRGTVESSGREVGVSVNGFRAFIAGDQWAAEVPVATGSTALSALATSPGGAQTTATVMVTGSDAAPLALTATPSNGVAPLEVTWHLTNQTGRDLVRFELDPLGTGSFGPPATRLDGSRITYMLPGLFRPTLRATDDQGNTYVASTLVQVDDGQAVAAQFTALWSAFRDRLRSGDQQGALARLASPLQPRFQVVFQQLAADLPVIAAGLGDLNVLDQVGDLADTALVQTEDGNDHLYFVYFRRDGRGLWLIEEM